MPKKPEGMRKAYFEHIENKNFKKLYAKEARSHAEGLF